MLNICDSVVFNYRYNWLSFIKQHFDEKGNMVGPSQCYFSVIEPQIALDDNEMVQVRLYKLY